MTTNKTVFFLIGILLIVLGVSMLAPYLVQVIYEEKSHSFISSSFVTIFIGILFILANLEKEFKLKIAEGIEKQLEQQSDQKLLTDVTEFLIKNTKFKLPKKFLIKWMQNSGKEPLTLEKALSHLNKSKVLKDAFSKETINSYIKLKNKETKKYQSSNTKKIGFKGSKQSIKKNIITQWEKDNTLDC